MQYLTEWIRKLVLLVLLIEAVLQLQAGKRYESYIKMLIGIMVVYNLVSGIFGIFGKLESIDLQPMQEYQWSQSLFSDLERQAKSQLENSMQGNITAGNSLKYVSMEEIEVQKVYEIDIPVFYVESFGE